MRTWTVGFGAGIWPAWVTGCPLKLVVELGAHPIQLLFELAHIGRCAYRCLVGADIGVRKNRKDLDLLSWFVQTPHNEPAIIEDAGHMFAHVRVVLWPEKADVYAPFLLDHPAE